MKELIQLRNNLCRELEEYGRKDLSISTLEVIDKIAHAIKNIDKVIENESGYSGRYESRDSRGGMGYSGNYPTYSYGDQPRDSMGRYSRGDMMSEMRGVYSRADDRNRPSYERFMDTMEHM